MVLFSKMVFSGQLSQIMIHNFKASGSPVQFVKGYAPEWFCNAGSYTLTLPAHPQPLDSCKESQV